jgi:hypothetical protein
MCRRLGPQRSFMTLGWLDIQHEVNSRPQEVRRVGCGNQCIHELQSTVGQFCMLAQHDNRDLRLDLIDLSRHEQAIQNAEAVREHNCIHRPRLEKA